MPVLLYLGEDDFSKGEALRELREAVGPAEMVDSNASTLEGARLTLEELAQACSVVPFLAAGRLVVVRGLLARFEPREARRGASRGRRRREGDLGAWAGLRAYLERDLPPTTTLVLADGAVGAENPLLQELGSGAQVRRFAPLPPAGVREWVRRRAQRLGQGIAPEATALLEEAFGSDLWALSQEVEKLCLYTQGQRPIEARDVRALVSVGREATVFQWVDAVVAGRSAQATRALQTLLEEGRVASYLLGMLGRQVRLLLEAQEALGEGLRPEEVGGRLGVRQGFPLQRLLEEARRHPAERLRSLHLALVEADAAIKGGVMEEATALELLASRQVGMDPRQGVPWTHDSGA